MANSQKMKLTSIGLIPEDWDAISLSKVGVFGKGSGVTRANAQSGNIPCIRYGEIYTSHNDYIKTFYSHISPEIASTATKLKKGDVLFAGSGETKEEIGKAVAFLGDEDAYAGGDIIILSPNMESSSMYLGYVLNSKSAVAQKASMGQGDAVVHIHAKELADVVIPWPKVEEQERIADALSSMDALISGLDEAIEKKRQIKEGLMQNLLTGRARLPGFNEKWIDVRLRDVCMMNSGGTPSTSDPHFYGGDILFLSISDMTNSGKYIYSTEKRITEDGYNCSSARMFPAGTLMYAMYASLGKCSITKVDVAVSQAILGFHSLKNIDTEYLYYYLASIEKSVKQTGQTGTQSNLSKNIVENFQLAIPSLEEQQAIASLLRTVDDDIDCCITKREKYNLIKQGMMQELLTGKTRLI